MPVKPASAVQQSRWRPQRQHYHHWRSATTRWADDDVYGHMNNATYFELIDTAVNAFLAEATRSNIRTLPQIGVVAEVSCRYFEQMGYPEPVQLGLAVERIGTSSIVYQVGLFQSENEAPEQLANAAGRFVHVYVDNTVPERPTVPIPDTIRSAVQPLLEPTFSSSM